MATTTIQRKVCKVVYRPCKEREMPFVSKAQQGYLNAHPEKLGAAKLAEFNQASKGLKLPARVKPTTHNSPPALSAFGSNNSTSNSVRQNLNPAPGQLSFAASEALSKDTPDMHLDPPNPRKFKDANAPKNPQGKGKQGSKAPASTGAPGNKPPQRAAGGDQAGGRVAGSISAAAERRKSLFDSGMISSRAMSKFKRNGDDDDRYGQVSYSTANR